MNKHLIILPILLASAISLHVLSFYIEEPEQIVNNPVASSTPSSEQPSPVESLTSSPVSSAPVSSNPEASPAPSKSVVASSIKTPNQQKSPSSATTSVVPSTVASSPSSVAPVPNKTSVPSQVPVATPTPSAVVVKVVSAYIKPKETADIIKEARMSGGRIDPFLSLKPPDITALPSLPPNVQKAINITKVKKGGKKGSNSTVDLTLFKEPPTIPNNEKYSSGSNDNIKEKPPTPVSVEPTQKPEDVIELRVKDRMGRNLTLTGIITGDKKFAIISVSGSNGSESKVVSIGQEVTSILSTPIKLISIDPYKNTVLVSSGRNSVILKMKESN